MCSLALSLNSSLVSEPKANIGGFRNQNLAICDMDKSRMQLTLSCPILFPEHFSTLQRNRKSQQFCQS